MTAVTTPTLTASDRLRSINVSDQAQSSFTNDDRRALIELGVEMRIMKQDFEELRKELRDQGSPSREDFRDLQGDVRNLQNFRWWILGGAAAVAALMEGFLRIAAPSR